MRYSPGDVRSTSAVSCTEFVEQPVGVGAVGQLGGERSRHGGAHAHHAQEVLRVRVQTVEDLAGQVLGDRALVARELGEEGGGVVGAAQRERGQPQAGCPAIRARMQTPRPAPGVSARPVAFSRAAVSSSGEPQDVGAELVQPTLQPQPGDRDRRVGPAGEDEPHAPSAGADQPGEVAQDLTAGQLVHVVEHEAHRRSRAVQHVGERLHEVCVVRRSRGLLGLLRRRVVAERPTAERAARSARPTTAVAGRCRRRPARSRRSPGPRHCAPSPPASASCRTRPGR